VPGLARRATPSAQAQPGDRTGSTRAWFNTSRAEFVPDQTRAGFQTARQARSVCPRLAAPFCTRRPPVPPTLPEPALLLQQTSPEPARSAVCTRRRPFVLSSPAPTFFPHSSPPLLLSSAKPHFVAAMNPLRRTTASGVNHSDAGLVRDGSSGATCAARGAGGWGGWASTPPVVCFP
jgi:hypothetical protein